MVRIELSRLALFDLKEIVDYIKRDSVKYAYLERKKIEQAINRLADQPLLGKTLSVLNDDNTREIVFSHYSIIYEIKSSEHIIILTIHHHARLLSNNRAFNDDQS